MSVKPVALVPSPKRRQGSEAMSKYMVAYARILVEKNNSITLAGVYFGGMGDTVEEAEGIARQCVNTIRGGTILPRVVPLEQDGQVVDALYEATEKFERITADMNEVDAIVGKRKK